MKELRQHIFEKLKVTTKSSGDTIFDNMVHWLQNKTQCASTSACEAVISFFVQNCEVFNEITE